MSPVERNLYHIDINHQIGFKHCLIRLDGFIFFRFPDVDNLLSIFGIEVSELVWVELVHNIFAEHIGEFVFLHLAVQCYSTHQLDILFLHAVPVQHLQERLNHNLPHIRFFGKWERLAVIVKEDEYLRVAVDEFTERRHLKRIFKGALRVFTERVALNAGQWWLGVVDLRIIRQFRVDKIVSKIGKVFH